MEIRYPLGIDDFANLRRGGFAYVDQSDAVREVLRASGEVLLLPRPRRFGKTLFMSMLRYFLERSDEDRRGLFAGLVIEQAGDEVWEHFGRYPVLLLSFKDMKQASWEDMRAALCRLLAREAQRLGPTLEAGLAGPVDRTLYESLLRMEPSEDALLDLTRWLHTATGQRVVVLIDEYDTPLHTALARGYYDPAITFLRNLLSGGLKGNPHLRLSVVTGILRVAKESIFSGLNNLVVHTVLSTAFAESFGFTEAQVARLVHEAGQDHRLEDLRRWYNGYRFGLGRTPMYNPWSVLSALSLPQQPCEPNWVATGADELLKDVLLRGGVAAEDLQRLLDDEPLSARIEEGLELRNLARRPGAAWSLLLYAGYLTPDGPPVRDSLDIARWPVAIPNREVKLAYRLLLLDWLVLGLGGERGVEEFVRALLQGNAPQLGASLARLLVVHLSYHDTGGPPLPEPERVYHAFVIGLLASLEPGYQVRSSRESGLGRVDVLVTPRQPGRPGAVLELKIVEPGKTPDQALAAAPQQMRELRAAGADPIYEYACAFDGKRAWVALI